MKLRPYQEECIKSVIVNAKKGVTKQLVVMPTGTGKTITFGSLPTMVKARGKKTLILAHREELLTQARDKISMLDPKLKIGIEQGGNVIDDDVDVVIASVPTLGRKGSARIMKFDPKDFGLIIIDEAHRSPAQSYKNILEHFDVLKGKVKTPNGRVLLGVTATPLRADKVGLDEIFDKITFTYLLREAIDSKYLSDIQAYSVQTQEDLTGVHVRMGDFAENELAEAIDTDRRNRLIVESYTKIAPHSKALIFAANVEHTKNLTEMFQSAGYKAKYVVGETDTEDRKNTFKSFEHGELEVLVNCMVACLDMNTEILTFEGWKKCDDVTDDSLVANWDIETGKIFFKQPIERIKRKLYPFEQMVSFQNCKNDIRVTGTHRMVYKSGNKFLKCEANDLIGKRFVYPSSGFGEPIKFDLKKDAKINEKRFISYTASLYRKKYGYDRRTSILEAEKSLKYKLSLQYKNPDELSLDECKFIGFWLGDGSKNTLHNGGIEYTLSQGIIYKKGVQWIDSILKNIDVDFIKREKNSMYVWSLGRGTGGKNQRVRGLYFLEKYLNKNGVKYFWGLNKKQFESLLEGLWVADGNHKKHFDVNKGSNLISNCNDKLINLLQAIAVCRGVSSNKSKVYKNIYSQGYINNLGFNFNKITRGVTSHKKDFRLKGEGFKDEYVWCVKNDTRNLVTRRNGKVCIMGNTEGYDNPKIQTVMMARPTKSSVLYQQMIGRGLRIAEGKDHLKLIDFVDNTGKNAIITLPNLFGIPKMLKGIQNKKITEIADTVEKILEVNSDYDVSKIEDWSKESIEKVIKRIDIFSQAELPDEIKANSKLSWERYKEGYRIQFPIKEEDSIKQSITIQPNILNNYEIRVQTLEKTEAVFTNGFKKWCSVSEEFLDSKGMLEEALQAGDNWVLQNKAEFKIMFDQEAEWRQNAPSEKQVALLKKLGVPVPDKLTKGQASVLIGKALNNKQKFNY